MEGALGLHHTEYATKAVLNVTLLCHHVPKVGPL